MEALKAASLIPLSVFSERKRTCVSRTKTATLKKTPPTFQDCVSRTFHGSLALLSSAISTGFAHALTYEEALQQTPAGSDFSSESGFALDGIVGFVTENPAIVAGGAAILAIPIVLSRVLGGKPKTFGVESAKSAYVKLGEDGNAQLLDIRGPKEAREVGCPDVEGLGKKAVSIIFNGEDKPGFLKKLALKFKEPENITFFVLDKFDGNSELVAELVTVNGFKAAYAIKDGAEGPRGWLNSGLPWIQPRKAVSFDLSGLTESISEALGEGSEALPVTLGLAAATGLGLVAFTEIETILQLLGSAALIQVVSKKLLFAEDRKQTLQQVDEFLNTKVAPKELVDELKQIGKALLPSPVNGKALPAPAEATTTEPVSVPTPEPAQVTAEATPEPASVPTPEPALVTAELKVEAVAEPALENNSVPKAEAKEESSLNGIPRPLSPYPYYPDLKPPTSPSPSQP